MRILGFLFIVIIFSLLLGFSILGGIIRTIWSSFRRPKGRYAESRKRPRTKTTLHKGDVEAKKKVFSKDEGEYVDFEEISD